MLEEINRFNVEDIRMRLYNYKKYAKALACMSFCVLEEIIYLKEAKCSKKSCNKQDNLKKDLIYRVLR